MRHLHFIAKIAGVGMIVLAGAGAATAQSWPGSIFDAEAGPLRIFNCSGKAIRVQSFNADDATTRFAYERKSIGNGSVAALKCATGSCKVRIGGGDVHAPLSGPQVLLTGTLQATNSAAVSQGCGVYAAPAANPSGR